MLVSVFVVRGILEQVKASGCRPEDVLRGIKLSSDSLADMRTLVHIDDFDTVLRRAMELTGNPGIGLSVALECPESIFQMISYLMLSVPTLREAFALIDRYSRLFVDDLRISMFESGDRAEFRFGFHDGVSSHVARFGAECVASFGHRIGSTHFTQGRSPIRVDFDYPAPAYAKRYEEFFKCEVRFEQPMNRIVFDRDILDQAQAHADAGMAHVLRNAAEEMLRNFGQRVSTAERLRTVLQREDDLCSVDLRRIAASLRMSARSLRRRLSEEGVRFSDVLQEARLHIAKAELLRPGASIKEVGERIGYSETTAFHRAFKRCTGLTPREYMRSMTPGRLAS